MILQDDYVLLEGNMPAFVVEMDNMESAQLLAHSEANSTVSIKVKGDKQVEFYPWGENNDFPQQLIELVYKNNVTSSNLEFNGRVAYGEMVMPVRREVEESGEIKYKALVYNDAPEIFDFLANNNYALIQQALASDLTLLNNGFVEFILNKGRNKIIRMLYKEAAYSRLTTMNKEGVIEKHGYCSDWSNTNDNDVILTDVLDYDNPLYDMMVKMGREYSKNGKKEKTIENRIVLHVGQPSAGKFYYQKAYWWSIFESGWFDFASAIPKFKMNLMKNQMVLKYHIQIRKGFFEDMFRAEKITDDKGKVERRRRFYQHLEDFLSGDNNAGKNMVTEFEIDNISKLEKHDIKITPIESFIKGGEYIEDSEEASNAICYAMGVHPSLQGASPGKNKNISGTEARELFTIKQSLVNPLRDLLVQPLKIVQHVNGWDKDIDFIIPNIQLTTLDKGTGAQKQIGNTKF